MSDAYVYRFSVFDAKTGTSAPSKRLATLQAISGRGEPIMESQLVLDSVELNGSGFLARTVNAAHPTDEMWGEIRSLNHRADSRDKEALSLSESTDGERKYLLHVESRELRKQVQRLQKQRLDLIEDESSRRGEAQDFVSIIGRSVAK